MRVKGVKTILFGLIGGLVSVSCWAAQSPKGFIGESGAAGRSAIHLNHPQRFAQAGQAPATDENPDSRYSVEGATLGDRVQSGSQNYKAFRCGPSEQFAQFSWCNRTAAQKGPRGEINSSYSILHSADGTIVYANRTLDPSFFTSASAKEEIQRLAQKLGAQPQLIELPHRAGLPDGVIAVRGNVVLRPVDEANIRQIASGKSPKLGFMIDFLSDFQRSAKMGLPVYRIGGGAGYVWAASFRPDGRGTLRSVAVDASKFSPPGSDQPVMAAQAQPPQQPQPQQAQRQQMQPQQGQAQPVQPQATERSNQPEPTVAELKQTIQSLKADLATSAAKVAALEKTSVEAGGALKQAEQAKLDAENAKQQIEQAGIASRTQLDAANTQSRFWKILASIATVGLIAALIAFFLRSRRTGEPTRQAAEAQSTFEDSIATVEPAEADRAEDMARLEPAASQDVLGRELEKHVANINATHSEPERTAKDKVPEKPPARSGSSDHPPIFY